MKITVYITRKELAEMEVGTSDFKSQMIYDLYNSRYYPDFDVEVIVVEESE